MRFIIFIGDVGEPAPTIIRVNLYSIWCSQCPMPNSQLPFDQLCILIKKLPGQSLSQQQSCDYSCQR